MFMFCWCDWTGQLEESGSLRREGWGDEGKGGETTVAILRF
jgi:hypothetical protein